MHIKKQKFIVNSLSLYYFAALTSDILTFSIGVTSITINHIILLSTITIAIFKYGIPKVKKEQKLIYTLFFLFFFYNLISLLTISFINSSLAISPIIKIISSLVNIIWLYFITNQVRSELTSEMYISISMNYILLSIIPFSLGCIEFINGHYIFSSGAAMEKGQILDGAFHIRATFHDRVDFATYISFSIFIAITLIQNKIINGFKKYFLIFYVIISLILILQSGSTTSIFGVSIAIIFLIFRKFNVKNILISIALASSIIYFGYFIINNTDIGIQQQHSWEIKYTRYFENYESDNFRYLDATVALETFKEHMIFGAGYGTHEVTLGEILHDSPRSSHTFLRIPAEKGLIGTLIFFLIFLIIYKKSIHLDNFLKPVLISMFIFITIRLTTYFHHLDQNFYFYFFALALLNQSSMSIKNHENSNMH